jgi:hypothetical protein
MKILYVAFWTFILNALCSYGYNQLAWFLLLLPFILFFVMILMVGTLLNKRTTSVPSPASSSAPFYQQQADAQAAQMQRMQQPVQAHMMMQDRERKRIHAPGSEQEKWFEPSPHFAGNRYNADGSGGQYSSYSDYDHSLDQRMKQAYKESREGGGKNPHYK